MSITTRTGDHGETDLLYGQRAPKDHPRIHALGDVDELNASLGPLRVHARHALTLEVCAVVQPWLIDLMGELATPVGQETRHARHHPKGFGQAQVEWLDEKIRFLEASGALQMEGWALPGASGSISSAHADMARAVCRRAERAIVGLSSTDLAPPNPLLVSFLNRLSDLLWLLARWEEKDRPAPAS